MGFLHAVILSIVEGITEFLPISSTGHMVLVSHLLGIPQTEFVKSFEIIIQLGAILAVLLVYWRKLLIGKELWLKLLVAFIPTAIIGLTLYKLIKHVLIGNPLITVIALLLGGIALILIEHLHTEKDEHIDKVEKITYKNAFLIGIFQSLSVVPGVSRAAATIVGGMLTGVKKRTAVEFSFLLAIPTMFAATALDIKESNLTFSNQEITTLLIGLIFTFIIALLAIKFFIKYIEKNSFIPFGVYRILLAVIYWFAFLR